MTVCGALVELGLYTPKPRGRPPLYESPEEALRVKKAQMKAAQIARREATRQAKERGEEPPVFKRGRPPIYASKEEALQVQRAQNRACRKQYFQRVEEVVREALRERGVQPARSSDEHNFLETS